VVVYEYNIPQHNRRTNNWSRLNNYSSNYFTIYCSTIAMIIISQRWNPQTNSNFKCNWTPMILKIWMLRIHQGRIRRIHNTPRYRWQNNILPSRHRQSHHTTNKLIIRITVTAVDVLHSWIVPRLGVKTDATSGRLNQCRFLINRPCQFYGQCSEICGSNHRFLPIIIERVSTDAFINWISNLRESSDDWKKVASLATTSDERS
jgi:hypothetical protein